MCGFLWNRWSGMDNTHAWANQAWLIHTWGETATYPCSHGAVCETFVGWGLHCAALNGCGEGSWRRRPWAVAERERTDTCWPLNVTAGKRLWGSRLQFLVLSYIFCLGASLDLSSIEKIEKSNKQTKRTKILNCTVSCCRNLRVVCVYLRREWGSNLYRWRGNPVPSSLLALNCWEPLSICWGTDILWRARKEERQDIISRCKP